MRVPTKNTLNRRVVLGGEAESESEGIRTVHSHTIEPFHVAADDKTIRE